MLPKTPFPNKCTEKLKKIHIFSGEHVYQTPLFKKYIDTPPIPQIS